MICKIKKASCSTTHNDRKYFSNLKYLEAKLNLNQRRNEYKSTSFSLSEHQCRLWTELVVYSTTEKEKCELGFKSPYYNIQVMLNFGKRKYQNRFIFTKDRSTIFNFFSLYAILLRINFVQLKILLTSVKEQHFLTNSIMSSEPQKLLVLKF